MPNPTTPESLFKLARLIWHVMLVIPIGIHLLSKSQGHFIKSPESLLQMIPTYLLFFLPVAFMVRFQLHRQGRLDNGLISPDAYLKGMLIIWVECAGILTLQALMPLTKGLHLIGPVLAYLVLLYHVPSYGKLIWQVDFGENTEEEIEASENNVSERDE